MPETKPIDKIQQDIKLIQKDVNIIKDDIKIILEFLNNKKVDKEISTGWFWSG